MLEQQLVDYIKKAREAGQSDDQTRSLLQKNGWTNEEVAEALGAIDQPKSEASPQIAAQQQKPAQNQQTQPAQNQPQPQPQPTQTQPKTTVQPQSQPQTQPSMQAAIGRTKAGSHMLLKVLMVLIIVVLLGVAAYFAGGQYLNLPYSDVVWNLFRPNPADVISKMTANMKNVKSSHATIRGEIDITGATPVNNLKILFNSDGDSDISDANNPKLNYNLKFSLAGPAVGLGLLPIDANIISLNKVIYFKLNDFPAEQAAVLPGFDMSKIKGVWFKVDQNSLAPMGQIGAGLSASQINTSINEEIQKLISSADLFSFNKQLPGQIVNGQDTHHYLITISKDKLKNLMAKIMALQAPAGSQAENNILIQGMMNAFIDALGDINLEIWIGKKDYMLYQSKIDKVIDLNKIFPNSDAPRLEIKFNVVNSNFNKPVSIKAPENAKKVEDIILPSLKLSDVKSDVGQIGAIADTLFFVDESYVSLCNRGLLNGYLAGYGKDLIDLNNSIISQGGKKPVCFSSVQDFCVSTQLPDGTYVCVDKNKIVGKTKCLSAATVCE